MIAINAFDTREEIIEVYLVLKGEVSIIGKESRILLENNNLYCISRHEYRSADVKEGTAGYIIRFNKRLIYRGDHEFYCSPFPDFYTLVLRKAVIKVGASFLKEGKKICDMIYHEYKYQIDSSMPILSSYLCIFLMHLMRQSELVTHLTGSESRNTLVRKFNILLEQHFKTNKKVTDYAALLFVTPRYLNEVMKDATGKSVSFHIRQRVVFEAVRQAKLTGASMKEVAFNLGFNDNAHFSKFFKRTAGGNFSDLRKYDFH